MRYRFVFSYLALFCLFSCSGFTSGLTPYQPLGYGGGYREMKIGPGTYEITCRGNGVTGQERVEHICLRRAAELMKAEGYSSFVFNASSSKEVSSQTVDTSLGLSPRRADTILTPVGNPSLGQYKATTTLSGGPSPTTMTSARHWVKGSVKGFKDNSGTYDVTTILESTAYLL